MNNQLDTLVEIAGVLLLHSLRHLELWNDNWLGRELVLLSGLRSLLHVVSNINL